MEDTRDRSQNKYRLYRERGESYETLVVWRMTERNNVIGCAYAEKERRSWFRVIGKRMIRWLVRRSCWSNLVGVALRTSERKIEIGSGYAERRGSDLLCVLMERVILLVRMSFPEMRNRLK
jgi:hypothetical protein